jgi:hypothetical protein
MEEQISGRGWVSEGEGEAMIACPVCGEELDLELEVPVGTLWDLLIGGLTCLACGTGEIGVIHPSTPRTVRTDDGSPTRS